MLFEFNFQSLKRKSTFVINLRVECESFKGIYWQNMADVKCNIQYSSVFLLVYNHLDIRIIMFS